MQTKSFLFFLLVAPALIVSPMVSHAQVAVGLSVHIGPPPLPVYVQPPCPEPGYIWTPGYWAYGADGYYWVPGAWVAPPAVGVLWTPGYWGWGGGVYLWHPGYWGPHVGFYGGINYGFGYTGVGFVGGYWRGGAFFYNRSVANINIAVIHSTYINRVVDRGPINRVSFNGGRGGIIAQPTAMERRYASERHMEATNMQMQHEHMAGGNRSLLASVNHGRPSIAATSRAGEFSGKNITAAHPANTNYRNNGGFNRGNNNTAGNSHNNGPNNNYGKSNNNNSGPPRNNGGSQRGGPSHDSQHEREHR